jgi:hypothetical protein
MRRESSPPSGAGLAEQVVPVARGWACYGPI